MSFELTELVDKYPDNDWDWIKLSLNKSRNIFYLVDKYPDKNWCYTTLSMRDDFDLGVVNNNPNKNWYLTRYIRNNLTIDEFIKYKSIKWDMLEIIDREDIMLFVDARPDYDWDWCNISSRYITMDFIERYQDKSWDWKCLTNNLNVELSLIDKLPHKGWDWKYLSQYKHIEGRKHDMCFSE